MQRTVEFDSMNIVEKSPRTVLVHGKEVTSIKNAMTLNSSEIILNDPISHDESDELYLGIYTDLTPTNDC
jgi:hypothetical protein